MKEPAVIYLLRTFSGQELKNLDKFLRSPYFTVGKNYSSNLIYRYFEMLKKSYLLLKSAELNRKKLYEELCPGKKYNDDIMRKLNSDLLKLVKKFLALKKFSEEKFAEDRYLLGALYDRKCTKIFYPVSERLSNSLRRCIKDENYFFTKSILDSFILDYNVSHNPVYKIQGLQEADTSIVNYMLLRFLNIYLSAISTNRQSIVKRKMFFFDEVMNYIEKNTDLFNEFPVIQVNLYLIKLHTTLDEKYFSTLKTFRKKHFNELDEITRFNYYIMMENFCLGKIWNGFSEYCSEKFAIDEDFLRSKLYKKSDGYIHSTLFINISTNALKMKKTGWVEEFIQKHKNELYPDFRDFTLGYVSAEICFANSDYNGALQALLRLHPPTPVYKQYIRNLTLKIYFEQNNFESANYLISSGLQHSRHEHSLTDTNRKNEMNFLSCLQKMIALKESNDYFKLISVKNEILKKQNIFNKDWLLEKIEEIK